jgi:DNA replication protein DnaC
MLLQHHLKALRLPVFLAEYRKVAGRCAQDKADYATFLLRLAELELLERERKGTDRRIRAARFPAPKSLDDFDFGAVPSLNKKQVLELARCEWIDRRQAVVLLGNPGTGKTHLAIALGQAAAQRGYGVRFFTAAGLVNALVEARNEKALLRLQGQLGKTPLLVIDELGYVPFSKTGAELLFEIFSQRYEAGSVLVTSNLPFAEWTTVLGGERLTAALLDRLTHHVHILPIEGESYRLAQSRRHKAQRNPPVAPQDPRQTPTPKQDEPPAPDPNPVDREKPDPDHPDADRHEQEKPAPENVNREDES